MATALTVIDEEDGGGFTARVETDAAAGTTITLYRLEWGSLMDAATWDEVDARTDSGDIEGTGASGRYWWRADARPPGGGVEVSNLVYRPLTDGIAALHDRIIDAVVERIIGLDLSGIQLVERQKVLSDANLNLPQVIVTAEDEAETDEGGTNARDDTGFPVLVLFVRNDLHDQTTDPVVLKWREQVRRAFRAQRLSGVAEVMTTRVEFRPVVATDARGVEFLLSGLLLRFVARESRDAAFPAVAPSYHGVVPVVGV